MLIATGYSTLTIEHFESAMTSSTPVMQTGLVSSSHQYYDLSISCSIL